ncbi:MAG: hypothetical protein ACKO23_19095 [Gemmataceae bacterium]
MEDMVIVLSFLAVVLGPISLWNVSLEVWGNYRAGKRCLATPLAITCIVIAIPLIFTGMVLEQKGFTGTKDALFAVGIGLGIGCGVFGAVGLFLDRRLKQQS